MIPDRSVKASSAKSVFFEDDNDIDIYIEDTAFGYSKLFTILFSRVFEGKYNVRKVFPLGGRDAVIGEHSANNSDRPSLFIVDGDLLLLTGDDIDNTNGLYKFPYYCVENILCDHESLLTVMDEEEAEKDISQIKSLFNYKQWLSHNKNKLFLLFVEYGISKTLNPTEPTVAFKVSELVSCNKGNIDKSKLRKRIHSLRKKTISSSSIEEYRNTRRSILNNFKNTELGKLDIVSGKDYLFPLLKTRAKSIVKTKAPDLNLKMRLAKTCKIDRIMDALNYTSR